MPWFLFRGALDVLVWRLQHRFALSVAGNGLVTPLARLGSARWMAFVHGLDLVAPYRIYQRCFVPSLRFASAVIANSRHTRSLALAKGVAQDRIEVVHPGVELAAATAQGFREKFSFSAGPLLLSVGRLVPRKGYVEFIEQVLPAVLERFPQATYVIVGAEAQAAGVPVTGMRARIEAAARSAGVADSVRLLGALDDAALAAAYAAAEVLVFPSTAAAGDVEGFGMVLLEAAAQGTPAVAFDTGGVGDAIARDSGVLVPEGDFKAFANAVIGLLSGELAAVTREGCLRHARANSWPQFGARVLGIARALAAPDGR